MFKGLRNRFVIMHMSTVTLIVILFFGTVLGFMYQNMDRSTNQMLDRELEAVQRDDMMHRPREGRVFMRNVGERFLPTFTIELDNGKDIKNVISMFALDDDFYKGVTQNALSKNASRSTVAYDGYTFKFLLDENRIIFLDISKELQMFTNTLYTFLWIALPLLVVIFFISRYFANRSIKPIEESYNKQKEFIADASHELKTPLAVISTNVDMLMDDATNEQRKWLDYIKKETQRMASLTSSLLYLTKLDYVKDSSVNETFDLSKLTEDYLIPLEAVFFENKIKTEVYIQPSIRVNGDSEQLRRLIGILVDNAIKYTDDSIKITLEQSGGEIRLSVCNTGKGISKEDFNKVWDRFYRGDKSRESTGGFGLGLPIAKAIAEKHKGDISVTSQENGWTKFTLKLPIAK